MAKCIIEKVNTTTAEIIGKTYDSSSYSGDVGSRAKIHGQTFITEDEIEGEMTVRGDEKDNRIVTVAKAEKVEIAIQLLNAESLADGRSLATTFLKDVWVKKAEKDGLDEIFVLRGTNDSELCELSTLAAKMAATETGARALGKWYPMDVATKKRVLIRLCAPVNEKGKITQA